MKIIYTQFLFIVFSVNISICQAQFDPPADEDISTEIMMKNIRFFAADSLNGRFPGSAGYFKAARFAAENFKSYGLRSPYNQEYFQELLIEYNEFTGPVKLEWIRQGKPLASYILGSDFIFRGFSGSGSFTAPLVFCGYGLVLPELNYDDYKDADVKGKWVIAFKQNPSWASKTKGVNDMLTRIRANHAAANGAKGLILVSQPNVRNPQKPIGSIMEGSGVHLPGFPVIHADIGIVNKWLENSNINLAILQSAIDSLKQPIHIYISDSVHVEVQTEYLPEKKSVNIIGIMEGSDEYLKNEYIVIGAHLDHVGRQSESVYFPGANDNASGSAAVMELARVFCNAEKKPARSIIFVLFTSEEQGLTGSEFFVEHPPVPLENIKAMLNLDCIGHGDSIQVGGGLSSPQLWNIALNCDSCRSKLMISQSWSGGGADAQAFYDKNIPTLYFASKYSYTHLHLPSDTPETLNPSLLREITRLVYCTAFNIAGLKEISIPSGGH